MTLAAVAYADRFLLPVGPDAVYCFAEHHLSGQAAGPKGNGHMRFFVNNEQTFELHHPLQPSDEVLLVQALSGG